LITFNDQQWFQNKRNNRRRRDRLILRQVIVVSKPLHTVADTPQTPETENDFLEEADEYEKAANKWKAG